MHKRSTYKVLYLLILASLTTQQCQNGCSKCNAQNQCLFCDFSNGFQLQNNTCVRNPFQNCRVFSSLGVCLGCNSGFYLQNNGCVAVTEQTQVLNCSIYSSQGVCQFCASGFYINGLTCEAVTTTIQNCSVYSGPDTCSQCNTGFILSLDNKTCNTITAVESCRTYSLINCDQCASGFFLQKDSIREQTRSSVENNNFESAFRLYNTTHDIIASQCQTTTVSNCKIFNTFRECATCQDGYYLKSGKCVLNPQEVIKFCQEYLTNNTCSKCIPGYYLGSESECKKVTPVNYCSQYSQTAKRTECTRCISTHYLKDTNVCQQRTVFFDNCQELAAAKDGCSICNANLKPTTDLKKCLPEVVNCKTYFGSNANSTALLCNRCVDGQYLLNEVCTVGNKPNCKIYRRLENICEKCIAGHYLDADNNCQKHAAIDKCNDFSPFVKDRCEKCSFDSLLFSVSTKCSSVTIENCKEPFSPTECLHCNTGFMLTTEHNCVVIPDEIGNCDEAEYGVCVKCKINYILEKGVCIEPLKALTQNCDQTNLTGGVAEEETKCEICKENSIPHNYVGSFFCMSDSNLSTLMDQDLDANCLAYHLDQDGLYKCARCRDGKFVSVDGVCQANKCDAETNFYYNINVLRDGGQYLVKHYEYCEKQEEGEDNFCLKHGLLDKQGDDDLEYGCYECKDSHYNQVDLLERTQILSNSEVEYENEVYYHSQPAHCEDTLQLFLNNEPNFCRYFYELHNGDYGCLRCESGYKGKVRNWKVLNCKEYSEETRECIECIDGYLLNPENHLECQDRKADVENTDTTPPYLEKCDSLSFNEEQCKLCQDGHALNDDFECWQYVAIDGCDIHYSYAEDQNSLSCFECAAGKVLVEHNVCENEIANCHKQKVDNKCEECDLNYELAENELSCSLVDNSVINELNTDTILVYDSIITDADFQCTAITYTPIDNCAEYDLDSIVGMDAPCVECDDGYYLLEETCVLDGAYKSDQADPDPNNCLYFEVIDDDASQEDDKYGCSECQPDHHFDHVLTKDLRSYLCVPDGSFYWDTDTSIQTVIAIDQNTVDCDLYDFTTNRCVKCKDDTHYLSKGHCCPLTEYYDRLTHSCSTITDFYNFIHNCLKLDEDERCSECADTFELTGEYCCAAGKYFNVTNETCEDLPDDCLWWDYHDDLCGECDTGNYMNPEENECCSYAEYHNGTDCVAIEEPNCERYYHGRCQRCLDDYFLTENHHCHKITAILNRCDEFDVFEKKCKKCIAESNKYGHYCCEWNELFSHVTGECGAIAEEDLFDNCDNTVEVGEDEYECRKCSATFYPFEFGGTEHCCPKGTYKMDSGDCVVIESENCGYFDVTNDECFTCIDSTFDRVYQSGDLCCPEGEYVDNTGECVPVTIDNCLRQDGTDCSKCSEGFQVSGDNLSCESTEHCLQKDGGDCIVCEYGYIANIGTCEPFDAASETKYSCYFQQFLEVLVCAECKSGYYNTGCCPYGQYYKNDRCNDIEIEGCASLDGDEDCDKCFQDVDTCQLDNNSYYEVVGGNYSVKPELYTINAPHAVNKKKLTNDQCCLRTQFGSEEGCQEYKVKNCSDEENGVCTECSDGYELKKGYCCRYGYKFDKKAKICVAEEDLDWEEFECPETLYLSNNWCCPENTYWNEEEHFCEQLIDANCITSESIDTCDQCANGYQLDDLFNVIAILRVNNAPDWCQQPNKRVELNVCINNANGDQLLNVVQQLYLDNCISFGGFDCFQCAADYYQTEKYPVCCPNGDIGFKFGGFTHCLDFSRIYRNCSEYDWIERKCTDCLEGHHLSQNRCCANNSYFNNLTKECDIEFANCKEFNHADGNCVECEDGHYFHLKRCCQVGQFWNGTECESFSENGLTACKFINALGECYECDDEQYLMKGRCCAEGQFWSLENEECQDILGVLGDGDDFSGYNHCLKVNDKHDCILCDEGEEHFQYDQRCCPFGHLWNFDRCDPIVNFDENCSKYEQLTVQEKLDEVTGECIDCSDDHYLVQNANICCPDQTIWDSDREECVSENIIYSNDIEKDFNHCKKSVDGVCTECETDYELIQANINDTLYTYCEDLNGDEHAGCQLYDVEGDCIVCEHNVASPCDFTEPNCVQYNIVSDRCSVCEDGYFVDYSNPSDIVCTELPDNCQLADEETKECIQCNSGYYLQDTECFKFGRNKNLFPSDCDNGLVEFNAGFEYKCLECDRSYVLSQNKENCVLDTMATIAYCAKSYINDDSDKVCTQCISNYTLNEDGQACCATELEFYNGEECQSFFYTLKTENCLQYENGQCSKCAENFNLYQNKCCSENKFLHGDHCINPQEEKCVFFETGLFCSQGCVDGENLNNHKCCPEGEYFDDDTWSCQDISIDECQQINDEGECQSCSADFYLDQNRCVPEDSYIAEDGSIVAEDDADSFFPNCERVVNGVCTVCKTGALGDDTVSSSKCCKDADNMVYYNKRCLVQPTLCVTFNFETEVCECDTGYSTGLVCCDEGKMRDLTDLTVGTLCVDITTNTDIASDCQQVLDEDQAENHCSSCGKEGEIFKVLVENKCCERHQFSINDSDCLDRTLFDDCDEIGDNGLCRKCSDGKVLLDEGHFNFCCDPGQNVVADECADIAVTITDCEIQGESGCEKCIADHYLVNGDQNCCEIGEKWVTDACVATLDHCIEFDGDDCTKCETGYYVNEEDFCCGNDEYFNTEHQKCQPFSNYFSDCEQINPFFENTKMVKCSQCSAGHYIGDDFCTDLTQVYNWDTPAFEPIDDFDDCQSVVDDVCTECSDGYYHNSDVCCLIGEHYNGTDCETLIDNCDKYENNTGEAVCRECDDGFYSHLGKCCAQQQINVDGTCTAYSAFEDKKTALLQCLEFDSDLHCTLCGDGFNLSLNGGSCCADEQLVRLVDGDVVCEDSFPASDFCLQYDETNFECFRCAEGFYLTEDHSCCKNGDVYFEPEGRCGPHDDVPDNCRVYNIENRTCEQCDDDYVYYNKECVENTIDDCVHFNPETQECDKCTKDTYLTYGHCCSDGDYWNTACVSIDISDCNQISDDGVCRGCSAGHYLNHNNCCEYGDFWNLEDEECQSGSIDFCQLYQISDDDCVKCDDEHVLLTLQDGERVCVVSDESCLHPHLDHTNNTLSCKQCFDEHSLDDADREVHLTLSPPGDSSCEYYNLRSPFEMTHLNCAICKADYYVDAKGVCRLRVNDTNCEGDLPYDSDTCWECADDYYLNEVGLCVQIEEDNCAQYDGEECVVCDAGYKLWHVQKGDTYEIVCAQPDERERTAPKFFRGYVEECVDDGEDSQEMPLNLPKQLDKFYNLYSCGGGIPVVFVKSGQKAEKTGIPDGIQRHNTLKTNSDMSLEEELNEIPEIESDLSTEIGYNNICSNGNDVEQITYSIIDNCAMLMINSQKTKGYSSTGGKIDLDSLNYWCTACKQGFKPVYNPRFPLQVTACVAIDNCAVNAVNMVNGCGECSAEHAWGYSNKTGVDYTKCISVTDTNCEVHDGETCHFCKLGHTLNYDNQCVQIEAPYCQDSGMNLDNEIFLEDLEYISNHRKDQNVCKQCDAGHTAFYAEQDIFFCTVSTTITNETFLNNSDVYDTNCLKYGLDGEDIVCKVCNNGFIVTLNGQCVSNNGLANCILAIEAGKCQRCNENSVVVNTKCANKNITNCKTYNRNPQNTQQICTECVDTKLLRNNTCIDGSVVNCKKYNNIEKCIKCIDQYALINLAGEKQKCVKVDRHSGCVSYVDSDFQDKRIRCERCTDNSLVIEQLDINNTVCNPLQIIENCAEYDKQTKIGNSTHTCTKCNADFYLTNNTCQPTTKNVSDCLEYSKTENKCIRCKLTHFLDTEVNKCVVIPSGVPGCRVYSAEKVCNQCTAGLYLFENSCYSVKKVVTGCFTYSNAEQCSQCDNGLVLENNRCITPTISCLVYANSENCSLCPAGEGIFIENEKKVCKTISKDALCVDFEQISPYKCRQCQSGFYLNSTTDKCESVGTPIANCDLYDNIDTCVRCNSGFALSVNKKVCSLVGDAENCVNLKQQNPFCVQCAAGQTLQKDGTCQSQRNPDGCLVLGADSKCALCLPGYFMNINKTCSLNGTVNA